MDACIEKTIENLGKNNMEGFYAETAEEAKKLLSEMLPKGCSVTCGGSVTLYKSGILDMLKTGPYKYYDRFASGLTPKEIDEIYRNAFSCDAYIMSSNAITENGELYNVDGNSNRVAALLFGPKNVYIIAGRNKIVPDIDAAVRRVKEIAAPKNCVRLKMQTPCSVTGSCMSLSREDSFICDGCGGDSRICCNYVISARQRRKGRIKVIIVGEEIGY